MNQSFTLGRILPYLGTFSREEYALVRKYGTEDYLDAEMWEDVDSYYDDFEDYMSYPWADSKVRDPPGDHHHPVAHTGVRLPPSMTALSGCHHPPCCH